jgi:ATPase subunit of ABC transporter with duplicated ATPase domains
MPGIKVGYLPQEPQLDPDKTVREEVESGLGAVMHARKRLEEVYAAYAEPDADFDKLATEQAELEALISTAGGDNTEAQLEIAADAFDKSIQPAEINAEYSAPGVLKVAASAWRPEYAAAITAGRGIFVVE